MLADDDHAVAREELGTFAVGGEEGAFHALETLRPVDRHTFARNEFGQRVGLSFDLRGQFGIDIDQSLARMRTAEVSAVLSQPALRVFMEDDEILGGRDPDHDLAQLAPFVMGAEQHG